MSLTLENYKEGIIKIKGQVISTVYMFSTLLNKLTKAEISNINAYATDKAASFVRSKFEDVYEGIEGALECPICKSKETLVTLIQLKSQDEPPDILIICKNAVCRKEIFLR